LKLLSWTALLLLFVHFSQTHAPYSPLYLFNHILKSICNQSTLRKKHNKIFMLNIVIPYGSAFLLGTSLATLFIKKILPISIIIGIITLVLIYLINYLFLSKFLHVSSNLQQ